MEESLSENRFEVVVCTGEMVITGIFSCGFEQRLIDALNEGVRFNPQTRIVEFIILQDADICGNAKFNGKCPQIYIAKHNIVFVAQVSSNKLEKPLTTYPFRPKKSTGVTILAAQANDRPYRLNGDIYIDSWGQIVDTLEAGVQFIPLTNVEIEGAPQHIGNRYDFLAINKQRILSICANLQAE